MTNILRFKRSLIIFDNKWFWNKYLVSIKECRSGIVLSSGINCCSGFTKLDELIPYNLLSISVALCANCVLGTDPTFIPAIWE